MKAPPTYLKPLYSMKDTKVNGASLNTAYVATLSWPAFRAEYDNVYGTDEKVLKYAYTLCLEAAGLKPVFKKMDTTPVNPTTTTEEGD